MTHSKCQVASPLRIAVESLTQSFLEFSGSPSHIRSNGRKKYCKSHSDDFSWCGHAGAYEVIHLIELSKRCSSFKNEWFCPSLNFQYMSENILATVIYLIISFLVTGYGLFLKRRVVNSEKEPQLNISGLNVSNLANPLQPIHFFVLQSGILFKNDQWRASKDHFWRTGV